MQKARQIVAQAFFGASERQIVPGNRDFFELGRFETFLVGAERPTNSRGGVHDNDRGAAGIRIDVDKAVQLDLEPAFFTRFPKRCSRQRLAAVNVAAWE